VDDHVAGQVILFILGWYGLSVHPEAQEREVSPAHREKSHRMGGRDPEATGTLEREGPLGLLEHR
jgi:hypothetical protein